MIQTQRGVRAQEAGEDPEQARDFVQEGDQDEYEMLNTEQRKLDW